MPINKLAAFFVPIATPTAIASAPQKTHLSRMTSLFLLRTAYFKWLYSTHYFVNLYYEYQQ